MTNEEKLQVAGRLLQEVFDEIYPDTIDPRTVAELEYFEELDLIFGEASDNIQKMSRFAGIADFRICNDILRKFAENSAVDLRKIECSREIFNHEIARKSTKNLGNSYI